MTFEKIFNQEGLYVADGFADGIAIRIKKNSLTFSKEMDFVQYSNPDDLFPEILNIKVYDGLFGKEYRQIFNRNKLFKKYDSKTMEINKIKKETINKYLETDTEVDVTDSNDWHSFTGSVSGKVKTDTDGSYYVTVIDCEENAFDVPLEYIDLP